MNIEELEEIAGFLRGIPGVTVLQADDPCRGEVGYVVWYLQKDGEFYIREEYDGVVLEEVEIYMMAKACRRISWVDGADQNGILPRSDVEMRITEVINSRGWCCNDDPSRRLMGFVKPRPIGSGEGSPGFMVRLDDSKWLPKLLKNRLMAWRRKNKDFREVALTPGGYLLVYEGE
jgi:hypothetical protein